MFLLSLTQFPDASTSSHLNPPIYRNHFFFLTEGHGPITMSHFPLKCCFFNHFSPDPSLVLVFLPCPWTARQCYIALSHLGFPGNLITSQMCSPTRTTNLLKQVSPQILLLASLYSNWMHPGSCQLPQELSQVPITVTGSQLVISTVTATGQDPTVLIPDEVPITLGYQSLISTEFHTDTTLSPLFGAPEAVPQLGGNTLRNRKELSAPSPS